MNIQGIELKREGPSIEKWACRVAPRKNYCTDLLLLTSRKKSVRRQEKSNTRKQSRIIIKFDNHVTSQHGGHFKSREIFVLAFLYPRSDLIRCKLVMYPWFCSARPRSFTCFKMANVYHSFWSKFPSQSEASITFLFRDQVRFSTSLLNLMYLSIFVRVAKNLALYPRFMLSIQHVSIVVHNLWKKCIRYFYSQCAFNNVGHIWLMSSSRCWDGRWCP